MRDIEWEVDVKSDALEGLESAGCVLNSLDDIRIVVLEEKWVKGMVEKNNYKKKYPLALIDRNFVWIVDETNTIYNIEYLCVWIYIYIYM